MREKQFVAVLKIAIYKKSNWILENGDKVNKTVKRRYKMAAYRYEVHVVTLLEQGRCTFDIPYCGNFSILENTFSSLQFPVPKDKLV